MLLKIDLYFIRDYLFKRGASDAAEGCLASVAAKLVKIAAKIITLLHAVEINQRRQNLGLKSVNLVRNFYVSNFNIHARGNKSAAAKFGPKIGKFGAKLLCLKCQHTCAWK